MKRLACLVVLSLALAQAAFAADDTNHDRMSDYLRQKFGLAREKAEQISNAVRAASERYALPPALILAIISIESRFKEKAKGANGATGLMQVVPGAHRRLLKDVKDLTEPETNIQIGSAILSGYVKSAGGDLNAALKNYGGSQAYAEKVTGHSKSFASAVDTKASAPAAAAGADQPLPSRDGGCDARWASLCIGAVEYAGPAPDAAASKPGR